MNIYLAASRLGKSVSFTQCSPPLRWIIVNYNPSNVFAHARLSRQQTRKEPYLTDPRTSLIIVCHLAYYSSTVWIIVNFLLKIKLETCARFFTEYATRLEFEWQAVRLFLYYKFCFVRKTNKKLYWIVRLMFTLYRRWCTTPKAQVCEADSRNTYHSGSWYGILRSFSSVLKNVRGIEY